jgi:hypothetical protein
MKTISLMLIMSLAAAVSQQKGGVTLTTSDAKLKETFDWAKNMALGYAHDGNDPVGYWYEAALPGREAFCMRDVSHQSIGGEILGLSPHNFNMMFKFAANISESKDWCSYWEINRYDKPAPVDYADDKQFWYTLTASPDIVNTCFRLYNWTGNKEYLSNPVLNDFYEKSLTVYLDRWKLNPDELMSRPRNMNTELPFRQGGKFNGARGIPSYVEVAGGFTCGVDLIAALHAACKAYGEMLSMRGEKKKAEKFLTKAETYKALINEKWWNEKKGLFETSLMPGGEFRDNAQAINGLTYVVWFKAASNPVRGKAVLDLLVQRPSNIENRSHYPYLMYRCHAPENAYEVLLSLKDMKRSSYPEVSFGVLEGIVAGMMGVRPSAARGVIQTLPQLTASTEWAALAAVPVLGTTVGISHEGTGKSVFTNSGASAVKWQACFYGEHKTILVNKKKIKADSATDEMGNKYSFVEVKVLPGNSATASVQ